MKLWTILAAVVAIDGLLNYANSYETPTHSLISFQAFERSVLKTNPDILSEIGIVGNVLTVGFPSEVPADEENPSPDETIFLQDATIRRILTGGSVLEDQSLRSPFHFYDQIAGGRGLTIGYPPFAYSFTASPDWIIEPEETTSRVIGQFQRFSYANTLYYYYGALTETGKVVRDDNFGLMFRGLGHVIHHLQDMSQPQHVRNDQHCEKAVSFFCHLADNPSHYEKYTDENREDILDGLGQYPVPEYARVRDFWINADRTGIAEYTQSNFVSQGSNFELDSLGSLSTNRRYPLPLPFQDNTTISFDLLSLLQEVNTETDDIKNIMQGLNCNLPLVCEMDFIASNVIDYGITEGWITVNHRASSISMLDDELRKRDIRKGITPTYNRLNFHAAYPYLLPRAVAYSAGLINHFFRARLQIDDAIRHADDTLMITVRNVSRADAVLHSGSFELYYDAAGGRRKPVAGLYISSGTLPVAVGGTIELSATGPDDIDPALEKPYLLIFNALEGRIGAEPAIAAIQLDLVQTGSIDRLNAGASECPARVYAVSILFPEQPKNQGRVLIQGMDSGAELDFTSIPAGPGVLRFGAIWSHQPDDISQGYRYEVTYRYPGATMGPCFGIPLGLWLPDETVRAIAPAN